MLFKKGEEGKQNSNYTWIILYRKYLKCFYLYSLKTWYLFICNLFTLVSEIKSSTPIYSLPMNYTINPKDFISDLYKYYLETNLKFRILGSQKRMIRSINLSRLYSCEQYIPNPIPQPTSHQLSQHLGHMNEMLLWEHNFSTISLLGSHWICGGLEI